MPAKSEKQRRFMGAVHSCKTKGKCANKRIRAVAKSISSKAAKDFMRKRTSLLASTKGK